MLLKLYNILGIKIYYIRFMSHRNRSSTSLKREKEEQNSEKAVKLAVKAIAGFLMKR